MLPRLSLRILIAAGVVLGGLCWLWALPAVAPADASTGITLFDAVAGWPTALGMLLLCGLPAIALGLAAGVMGNPLAGPFVTGFGLMILAGQGGSSRGFLWRADLPGSYVTLIGEMLIWSVALVAFMGLIGICRRATHRRYPNLTPVSLVEPEPIRWRRLRGLDALAGVVAAAIGVVLCGLLIQSASTGQVLGSLVLGFGLAALLAQLIVPHHNPLPILLAPAIAAIFGYTRVLLTPELVDPAAVQAAWYTGGLSGLAVGLPMQYASAGVVGVTLGIGLGRSLDHARAAHAQATE